MAFPLPILLAGGAALLLLGGKKKRKSSKVSTPDVEPPDADTHEPEGRSGTAIWIKRQEALAKVAKSGLCSCDPGKIDGKVGPSTRNAIKAFQLCAGIEDDGKWGSITNQKMNEFLAQVNGPSPLPEPAPLPKPAPKKRHNVFWLDSPAAAAAAFDTFDKNRGQIHIVYKQQFSALQQAVGSVGAEWPDVDFVIVRDGVYQHIKDNRGDVGAFCHPGLDAVIFSPDFTSCIGQAHAIADIENELRDAAKQFG